MELEDGEKQFEELVIPLMDELYRFACRLERDSDRAQDLLQDSLLKGFRRFRALRKRSSFRSWIAQILYRTFLDKRRAGAREIPIEQEECFGADLGAILPFAPPDLASVIASCAASREIGIALDRLPRDQAVAVLLVDVEEYGYEEAAGVLGVSPGTVASRVARGRAGLRATLRRLAVERGWMKT